jgi:hypothetical protein
MTIQSDKLLKRFIKNCIHSDTCFLDIQNRLSILPIYLNYDTFSIRLYINERHKYEKNSSVTP